MSLPPSPPRDAGLVVATTRARPEAPEALGPLVDAGAEVLHVPLVRQELVDDARAVTLAVAEGGWTDLVLTSANGVRALARALQRAGASVGPAASWLRGLTLWAIGPATARALETELGVGARGPDHVPATFTAAGLLEHAARVGVAGRRFLYPAAAQARAQLPDGLRRLGAHVTVAVGYDTVPRADAAAHLVDGHRRGLSLVLLASPSAARALVTAWEAGLGPVAPPAVAAIGPTTADAARAAGLRVTVTAQESTMRGLCRAAARAALGPTAQGAPASAPPPAASATNDR